MVEDLIEKVTRETDQKEWAGCRAVMWTEVC